MPVRRLLSRQLSLLQERVNRVCSWLEIVSDRNLLDVNLALRNVNGL